VKIRDQIYCGDCAERIRQKQTKRAAAPGAATGARPKTGRRTRGPDRGGRPGTARRTKTGMRKRPKTGARRRRPEEEDEHEDEYYDEEKKSNLPLILGISGGGLALLILIIVAVMMSDGDGDEGIYEESDEDDSSRYVQQVDTAAERRAQAASEWRKLESEIERLKRRREYGAALAKLSAFMNKWSGTDAAREAKNLHDDITRIKADWDVFEPYHKRAKKLISEQDCAGAMREYSEFGKNNLRNDFLSDASDGFRNAGNRLRKKTGVSVPLYSGFDSSFLDLGGNWYVKQDEIMGEGPGTVSSKMPGYEKWLDYKVTMEIMVESGNPQFMVRGVEVTRDGDKGFVGAWKTIEEDILPHGSYVTFELKVSGKEWVIIVDGVEQDTAPLDEDQSHAGTVAFKFAGDGRLRIRKLEITLSKYE